MKITEYRELPVASLRIGLSQARVRDVSKNIDDLAQSIKTLGLLEPIVVAPTEEGEYEVVTGQRRFLAVQSLGWEHIRAGILDEKPDGNLAKAISLTENMVREDMADKDYIDACTALFRHYGSIKAVSEELGLPYHKVQQFVKYDQLIDALREKVDSGDLKMSVALRAQKAATRDGTVIPELAEALASEMSNMATPQQTRLQKVAQMSPNATVEEILEAGRKQARVKNLTVTIDETVDVALGTLAEEEGTNRQEAAESLILSGLTDRGYLSDSD